MTDTPIRARDVTIAHIYQARCERSGCPWSSELLSTYHAANMDRQAHLDLHRRRAAGEDINDHEFEAIASPGAS